MILHVKKLQSGEKDDDSVTLPAWVFVELQIQVGKPVSVTLDKALFELQEPLKTRFKLMYLKLEPLQANYMEMGMKSDTNDNITTEKRLAAPALQRKSTVMMNKDRKRYLQMRIKAGMREYRLLRPNQVLEFFQNEKRYKFGVTTMNTEWSSKLLGSTIFPYSILLNLDPDSLRIELQISDRQRPSPQARRTTSTLQVALNARFAGAGPGSSQGKAQSPGGPQPNESIDLDLILKERGLDIFYMQQIINEYKLAKDIASKSKQRRSSGPKHPEPASPTKMVGPASRQVTSFLNWQSNLQEQSSSLTEESLSLETNGYVQIKQFDTAGDDYGTTDDQPLRPVGSRT